MKSYFYHNRAIKVIIDFLTIGWGKIGIKIGESMSATSSTIRWACVKLKSQKGYGGIPNDCIRIIS